MQVFRFCQRITFDPVWLPAKINWYKPIELFHLRCKVADYVNKRAWPLSSLSNFNQILSLQTITTTWLYYFGLPWWTEYFAYPQTFVFLWNGKSIYTICIQKSTSRAAVEKTFAEVKTICIFSCAFYYTLTTIKIPYRVPATCAVSSWYLHLD